MEKLPYTILFRMLLVKACRETGRWDRELVIEEELVWWEDFIQIEGEGMEGKEERLIPQKKQGREENG